jgi:hypothetical protein
VWLPEEKRMDQKADSPPYTNPDALNVTALAKRFGVARSTIRRRLAKGWVPPATAPQKPRKAKADAPARELAAVPVNAPVERPPDAPPSAPSVLQRPVEREEHTNGCGIGVVLMGTATAIAALAITINAQTGWRFGTRRWPA